MMAVAERVGNLRGLTTLPPVRPGRGFRRCTPRATLATHGPLTAGTARGLASAAINGGLWKGQWGSAFLHLAAGGRLVGIRLRLDRRWRRWEASAQLAALPAAAAVPAGGGSGAASGRTPTTTARPGGHHRMLIAVVALSDCLPAAGQLASSPWQGPGEAAWLTMASLFTLAASFSESQRQAWRGGCVPLVLVASGCFAAN